MIFFAFYLELALTDLPDTPIAYGFKPDSTLAIAASKPLGILCSFSISCISCGISDAKLTLVPKVIKKYTKKYRINLHGRTK